MKLSRLVILAALVATPALADDDMHKGLYGSIAAGIVTTPDLDIEGTGGLAGSAVTEADLDTGWVGATALGWKLDNGLRAEVEVARRKSDVDDLLAAAPLVGPVDGDYRVWSFMGNIVYDVPTGERWEPYIGAGAGLIRGKLRNVQPVDGVGLAIDKGSSDDAFAYQVIAGMSYDLTTLIEAFADYRYLASTDDLNVQTAAGGISSEYKNHSFMVGIRWYLNGPAKADRPAAYRKAAVVASDACGARDFLVFFDWDRSNLSAEAASVLGEAAEYIKAGCTANIGVVGHTDLSGPPGYNVGLSKRRSESVATSLIQQGVPAEQISVDWRGESEPLVPTDDGVREPQNRRVQIELKG